MIGDNSNRLPATSRIDVYCDGSVSPAVMDTSTSSVVTGTFVGRIAVLIPDLDYGLIEKNVEGATTSSGDPASTQMEVYAVKRAKDICTSKRLDNYMILTDSQGADRSSGVPEARWLEPGRLHYASLFLDRILNRGRYLRKSSRKVIKRKPLNRLQEELYRFFQAERIEFNLSESLLWQKLQMEMAVAD